MEHVFVGAPTEEQSWLTCALCGALSDEVDPESPCAGEIEDVFYDGHGIPICSRCEEIPCSCQEEEIVWPPEANEVVDPFADE